MYTRKSTSIKKTIIGIDFDNTIVRYDDLFYKIASKKKLIPENIAKSKASIRDYLRKQNQEDVWTELQGYIYGTKMELATSFPGVTQFFKTYQKSNKITPLIISHKTRYPYFGPKYDLHKAAKKWIQKQPFFQKTISTFFEPTLEKKICSIKLLKCNWFIDDLPELLLEKNFPKNTQKILFDPDHRFSENPEYIKFSSWFEIINFFSDIC